MFLCDFVARRCVIRHHLRGRVDKSIVLSLLLRVSRRFFRIHRVLSPCHLAPSSPRHFRSHFRCLGCSYVIFVARRWVIRHHLLRGHGEKAPFVESAAYFSSFFRDYRAPSHRAPSSVVCGCSHSRRSSAFPCALRGEASPLRRAGAAWCHVRGGARERREACHARVPCDARGKSARGLRALEEPAAPPELGAASLSRFGPSPPLAACAAPPNACGVGVVTSNKGEFSSNKAKTKN